MKIYTVSVKIELPRDEVIRLFDDPANLAKWQTGLQSFEHISGTPGQVGAQAKLIFHSGKNVIELLETITVRNLPDELSGSYEWGHGRNSLENRFVELASDCTELRSTCSYEFDKLFLKAMGLLAPGMFRKQNQKFLDNFKAFCEHGTDVRESVA